MKTLITITLVIAFTILLTTILMAQPPGLPATPSQAPIDGGLGLLAAAGGGYALKKLRDRRQTE
ncbi:PID-CTERM protein-sorting domain-containing protein [Gracilimonas tropica]|uniref:PID-CTERM protein-sorting domain-containing protein n=1 Tax=Gracilimonas tropica TaxID=454600 RepID=UPI00036F61A0|nr:hypothetical protein [Gracilimonas tropica]